MPIGARLSLLDELDPVAVQVARGSKFSPLNTLNAGAVRGECRDSGHGRPRLAMNGAERDDLADLASPEEG